MQSKIVTYKPKQKRRPCDCHQGITTTTKITDKIPDPHACPTNGGGGSSLHPEGIPPTPSRLPGHLLTGDVSRQFFCLSFALTIPVVFWSADRFTSWLWYNRTHLPRFSKFIPPSFDRRFLYGLSPSSSAGHGRTWATKPALYAPSSSDHSCILEPSRSLDIRAYRTLTCAVENSHH